MIMPKNQNNILALYPNTRGLGYACMEGASKIIDVGVRNVRPINNRKVLEYIDGQIRYYEPVIILLQDNETKHNPYCKRVTRLIRRVEKKCNKNGIQIFKYSREQVRFVFEQFGAKTKYEIAKKIVTWFPELEPKMPEARKLWMPEGYYMGIFDAISLAIAHQYLND